MRRGTSIVRDRELEGSERSAELATALAQICDPGLLEALVHAKAMLDYNGGQIFIAAVRNKYRITTQRSPEGNIVGETRTLLENRQEPGNYETDAYVFHFDHIATALRSAKKEPDTQFPVDSPASLTSEGEVAPLVAVQDQRNGEVAEALTPEPEPVTVPADIVEQETEELNQNPPGDTAFEGG